MDDVKEAVCKAISSYADMEDSEVELRFGTFDPQTGRFDSDVSRDLFYRILKYLNSFDAWENVEQTLSTSSFGDDGKRLTRYLGAPPRAAECVVKKKMWSSDIRLPSFALDVRVAASREIESRMADAPDIKFCRGKDRIRFCNPPIFFDLTIVTETHRGRAEPSEDMKSSDKRYEVEIEIDTKAVLKSPEAIRQLSESLTTKIVGLFKHLDTTD